MTRSIFAGLFVALVGAPAGLAVAQTPEAPAELVAIEVEGAPVVDGVAEGEIWSQALALVTHDPLAEVDLTVKAVFSGDMVYVLARFPDDEEDREHKTQEWVADQHRYRVGAIREDTFVIKWSMEAGPIDLSISADRPYRADIWYWKANRTDPSGYADDKMHVYSPIEGKSSKMLISKSGLRFFLERPGDTGVSAYKTLVYTEFGGDALPFYAPRTPQGSRADVRAKGVWRDGMWTVEFARKLATKHSDDVQFNPDQVYQLGVSRYEIAGRMRNAAIAQPWFGAGEITGPLTLRFQRSVLANR